MNPAEFKTLREAVGLSISTLVKVIDVDERTIRKWESGKKKLPADVIKDLEAVNDLINNTVNDQFQNFKNSESKDIVLKRFIEEEDLLDNYPEFESLPMTSYGVVLFRLKQKLVELDFNVSIEYV